jgi:acetyltransferase-like isoleucine patch superfamily enzyme
MNHFAHPQAIVQSRAIGTGTRVWAFAHVCDGAVVGANCNLGDHCFLEGGCQVGDNVTVKNGVMIWEGITVADDVFIGPGVVFTNDRYPRSPRMELVHARYATKGWLAPTQVGRGVAIGANATIGAGLNIGEFAMIGAGAVVTKDVPAYTLVYGNPARTQGHVCACGQPLKFVRRRAQCATCRSAYRQTGKGVSACG